VIVSANDRDGSCTHAGGVVTCDLSTLEANSHWTIQIVVTPTRAGTIVNTASASAIGDDPRRSNNTRTERTTVTTPPNLLRNPGFELDADRDGKPDVWSRDDRFSRSSAVKHSDKYAGRHSASRTASYTIRQTVADVRAGATYRFSGEVNIPSNHSSFTFKIQVRWLDGDGKTIRTDTIRTFRNDTRGDWKRARADMVAPSDADRAQIRMVVQDLVGKIYVDDFVFQKLVPSAP
jgi:hypothetical protein